MAIQVDQDWLSLDETAALLKVSKITLHRWIKQGRLPAFRVGPRKLRIRRADLGSVFVSTAGMSTDGSAAEYAALDIRPMTPEERQRQFEALREAEAFQEELLAQRGGVPFSSSVPLIRQSRRERSRQLS